MRGIGGTGVSSGVWLFCYGGPAGRICAAFVIELLRDADDPRWEPHLRVGYSLRRNGLGHSVRRHRHSWPAAFRVAVTGDLTEVVMHQWGQQRQAKLDLHR